MNLSEITDEREALLALRRLIAKKLETDPGARDFAALSRQYVLVGVRLAELDAESTEPRGALADLRRRRVEAGAR